MKQTTLRLDDEILKEVKRLLIDVNKSFNEYVTELIKKDLDERNQSQVEKK